MKNLLALLIAFVFLFASCGGGSEEPAPDVNTDELKEETMDSPTEVDTTTYYEEEGIEETPYETEDQE